MTVEGRAAQKGMTVDDTVDYSCFSWSLPEQMSSFTFTVSVFKLFHLQTVTSLSVRVRMF
jgi:hypothetical protein